MQYEFFESNKCSFEQGGRGFVGLPGPDGLNGAYGSKGAKGEEGFVGAKGLIGLRGEDGYPGNVGLPGDAGIMGDEGKSESKSFIINDFQCFHSLLRCYGRDWNIRRIWNTRR